MAETLFSYGGLIAMIGWIVLAASLFIAAIRPPVWIATGFVIPGLLALAYIYLLWQGWGAAPDGGFGSLPEIRALFSDDSALAAGWIHYLAFDLFVGTWIVRTGLRRGVHPLLLLLPLPFTFMFGPVGLLLAILILLVSGRLPLGEK